MKKYYLKKRIAKPYYRPPFLYCLFGR